MLATWIDEAEDRDEDERPALIAAHDAGEVLTCSRCLVGEHGRCVDRQACGCRGCETGQIGRPSPATRITRDRPPRKPGVVALDLRHDSDDAPAAPGPTQEARPLTSADRAALLANDRHRAFSGLLSAAGGDIDTSWLDPPAWQADGACREHPELDFHPERGVDTRPLKAVCAGCLVREQCLEYALTGGEKFGIWGGMSERERRRVRRARLDEAAAADRPGISIVEAAAIIGCSASALNSRVQRGTLDGWRDHRGAWRFDPADIREIARRERVAA